jgi:GTP:adenosylcobinamide-phosphate guanylyltransferase
MKKIITGQIDFPSYTSEEFKTFVRDVVQKEARKRPNISQMAQHQWIQKYEKEGSGYNRDLLNQVVKILK